MTRPESTLGVSSGTRVEERRPWATGVLTTPGPLHLLSLDAPNVAITMLPLVLVPTIAVPFSIFVHLVALHRLVGRVQPAALGLSKAA